MPLTRSSTRQMHGLTIKLPTSSTLSTLLQAFSRTSSDSSDLPQPLASTPTTPTYTPAPTHCACGCHRSSATIFESFTCGLNLSLSRTHEDVQKLIHECVRKDWDRYQTNPAMHHDAPGATLRPFEVRGRMLETAREIMKGHVKDTLSSLAESLSIQMMDHVESSILEEWRVQLRDDGEKCQDTAKGVDAGMLTPDLSQMSASLSSVSLEQPTLTRTRARDMQRRRDSPFPKRQLVKKETTTEEAEEGAKDMDIIVEETDEETGGRKRKHQGPSDGCVETAMGRMTRSKKTRLT